MKSGILFIGILMMLLFTSCKPDYKVVEATIIDLKTDTPSQGVFTATVEYFVDSVRYTGQFEVKIMDMVEDSISTPAPGIKFDIMYNPENPSENEIEFNVKAIYRN